jgi:light-regulated signal transduction histidine kinase (bacteriophytochrome)
LSLQQQELENLTRLASHDLQGPLLQVSAFSEVLRQELGETISKPVATSLHYITEGIQQMHALLQGLLAFSHLGQTTMQRVPVRLADCVQAALGMLRQQTEATQAEMVIAPLPEVLGDPTRLTQLYQHLLRNALQYVGTRPPRIRLTAQRQNALWLLGVHDNGIGLDQKYAEYIFMPFNRLHSTSAYKGTGIGLAMCRKIVERHGGRIWVESTPGQGATFYFTLYDVMA